MASSHEAEKKATRNQIKLNINLLTALNAGKLAKAMLYLSAGADINTPSASGKTIFLLACKNNEKSFVAELILREDIAQLINKPDNDGGTALIWAAVKGHTAIVDILLKAGAKFDIPTNAGLTPLHWAAANDHTAIVDMLLKAGAAPDIQNNNGWTALKGAAYNGHTEVASMLVCRLSDKLINYVKERLVSPDVELNGGNHSALSIALIMDRPEIIAALLDHPGIDLGAGTTKKIFAQHDATFAAALKIWTEKAYPAFEKEFYKQEDSGQYVVEKTQSILQQKQHLTRQLIDLKACGFIDDKFKRELITKLDAMLEKRFAEVKNTKDFLGKWQERLATEDPGARNKSSESESESKSEPAEPESKDAKPWRITPDNVAAFELTAFLDQKTKDTVAKILEDGRNKDKGAAELCNKR